MHPKQRKAIAYVIIILLVGVLAAIIHNFFYALTGIEEAVFFIIGVSLIFLAFPISIAYAGFTFWKYR